MERNIETYIKRKCDILMLKLDRTDPTSEEYTEILDKLIEAQAVLEKTKYKEKRKIKIPSDVFCSLIGVVGSIITTKIIMEYEENGHIMPQWALNTFQKKTLNRED